MFVLLSFQIMQGKGFGRLPWFWFWTRRVESRSLSVPLLRPSLTQCDVMLGREVMLSPSKEQRSPSLQAPSHFSMRRQRDV